MPSAIEFESVTKTYGRGALKALNGVSFETRTGDFCAFLGPNGAGKTTSIGLLMGFHRADSGKIRVLGREPGDVRAKAHIGFLPENFEFHNFLTAPKLLHLHLKLAGLHSARGIARIPELLARVGLEEHKDLKIAKYSRGMAQRLGLAQALLTDPELLILDEPTSGLDPGGRKEIVELLAGLKGEGKTVFLSSHILPEVEQVCDDVVILDRGRVVKVGRIREMLEAGNRVQVVANRLTPGIERTARERGAIVDHGCRRGADGFRGPPPRARSDSALIFSAATEAESSG